MRAETKVHLYDRNGRGHAKESWKKIRAGNRHVHPRERQVAPLDPSGHRPDRNPAAQQPPGVLRCAILSSEAREALGCETARVHHATRRRGGRVAARGAGAAAGAYAAHRHLDVDCGRCGRTGTHYGRNLRVDTRWAAGDTDRMTTYVTGGGDRSARAGLRFQLGASR